MTTMHDKQLVLKEAHTHCKRPCALCGFWDRPWGLAIYTEGTNDFVRESCAKEIAPDLVDALRAWQAWPLATPEHNPFAQEPPAWLLGQEGSAPDCLKMQPAPDAIRPDALIDQVILLAGRADELLARGGDAARPSDAEDLFALGEDICNLGLALSHARPALHILLTLAARLGRRAEGYAEVFGTRQPDGGAGDFCPRVRIPYNAFGERFARFDPALDLDLSDEDAPF